MPKKSQINEYSDSVANVEEGCTGEAGEAYLVRNSHGVVPVAAYKDCGAIHR